MAILIDGPNADFASRLIGKRGEKGLTQQDLGALVGIDKRTISQYENGHSFPRAETIRRLAASLEVDATWLATGNTVDDHKFFAERRRNVRDQGLKVDVSLVFIEDWKTLSSGSVRMPIFNAEGKYGPKSADIHAFVPVIKTFFDQHRATVFPGALPYLTQYPGGSVLIFDAALTAVEDIDSGSDVIYRYRGEENAPGLRRLAKEPGQSEAVLMPLDPAMPQGPIALDPLDIEILGTVISHIIRRSPDIPAS